MNQYLIDISNKMPQFSYYYFWMSKKAIKKLTGPVESSEFSEGHNSGIPQGRLRIMARSGLGWDHFNDPSRFEAASQMPPV